MKLLESVNMELNNECRIMFEVKTTVRVNSAMHKKFICKLLASDNSLIKLFADTN
jgi:hypothetical protein